jgi:hypothetical protein
MHCVCIRAAVWGRDSALQLRLMQRLKPVVSVQAACQSAFLSNTTPVQNVDPCAQTRALSRLRVALRWESATQHANDYLYGDVQPGASYDLRADNYSCIRHCGHFRLLLDVMATALVLLEPAVL